jgi:hypothetical protein
MRHTILIYGILLLITASSSCDKTTPEPSPLCVDTLSTTIENFKVFKHSSGVYYYRAKFAVDADGSPRAYGPNDSGLDLNIHAFTNGKWVGVVTGSDGKPIIQKQSDPYPGFFVSQTSLYDTRYEITDPRRYVDAENVPYIVLPDTLRSQMSAEMGDMAYVFNPATQKGSFAIFADTGPEGLLGEGSIYLAKAIGIANINPRDGGLTGAVIQYVVFPKSGIGNGKHRTVAEIEQVGRNVLAAIGGKESILKCF